MAQEILNDLLNSKILSEEIIKWLTTDNQQNFNWAGNENQNLTKTEFVACFLNFLRDQFTVAQQTATNVKQTPSKETVPKVAATSVISKQLLRVEENSASTSLDLNKVKLDSSRPFVRSDYTPNHLPNEEPNASKIILKRNPENRRQHFESNRSCDNVFGSENKFLSPQTSQPTNKKRISLQTVKSPEFAERNLSFSTNNESKCSDLVFSPSNFQQQKEIDLSHRFQSPESFSKTSPNVRNIEYILSNFNRILSPGNDSFSSPIKDQSSSFNASFLSQNYPHNDCSSNSSQASENSVKSDLQFVHSPIHNDGKNMMPLINCQTITPKNCQKSQKKSSEKHSRSNNSHFKHSTPEQNANTSQQYANTSQKSAKSSSRQNVSLGDFLTIDTRSSKRNSGKGSNQRSQTWRQRNEDISNSPSLLSEDNFPEMGQSFERRRRINPTKLDVSDNKGDKENTVFGIVNRPVIANPQFSEVQSTDQTPDKSSFETERVLLRLERQKKPESVVDNKIIDLDTPTKTVRPARISVVSKSIVVPSLAMVDKKDLLETLAQLYCVCIDNNLILNPMTEMYFILSLITTQYFLQNSPRKCGTKKSPDASYSLNSGELKQEDLEVDLGCAVLTDEANQDSDKLKFNENVENFVELAIDEETATSKICDKREVTCDEKSSSEINDLSLGTPHNCVFFSTRVLNQERHLFKYLDRTTLKLLSENSNIAAFQPDLQAYLKDIYHLKLSEMNRVKQQTFSAVDPNVSFQMDTDNRENFPSSVSFQAFRKQRDMFYEILKIWEENHLKSNWKYPVALSQRIKMMLTLHSDITNHCHMARLFKSQLLISCIHSGQQEDFIDDESLSILKSLKDINPEKLTQLKERLVTPLSSKGPVPEPNFPGVQEFYKNFILYAFNPMFNAHLEDCIVHEIWELNDAQFTGSEIEDTETMVDERTKQNFMLCLSRLRLLAKFFGFLVSLPYRSSTSALTEIVKAQISLRSRFVPVLNLQGCLQDAIIQGKLSLTIPWMVEYLSQLDNASFYLPYYRRLLEVLYCIYRISISDIPSEQFMSQQTSILIKFSLGWLFELPNFPTDLYFSCQSNYTNGKLKAICQVENQNMEISVASNKNSVSLDKLDIIDESVLYSCCPFLVEFKILLTGNSQATNNKTNRHITPVSSQLQSATESTNAKNLELQLEEAFFHGQPTSTRKTVEFVSERVASTCVKYICNTLIPTSQDKNLNALRKVVEEKYSKNLEENPEFLKKFMMKEMNKLNMDISKEVKEQIEKEVKAMCKSRIAQSIDSLLAEDTLLPVKEMCTQIAIRIATDRISQWIQSHSGGSLFMRDMEFKISQIVKSDNSTTFGNQNIHNPLAACPTDVLDILRECFWDFMENRGKSVTMEFTSKILDELYSCFIERADLMHGPSNCLRTMSVDFLLFLVTFRKELLTIEIQMKFVKFWKLVLTKIPESEFSLSRILSPRNILICRTSNDAGIWTKFGQIIKLLLKEEVLSLECLSDQSVALLREEWPTETLQNLSKCLMIGIEDYRPSDESAERIRYLLRWIAETYKDIDNLDH